VIAGIISEPHPIGMGLFQVLATLFQRWPRLTPPTGDTAQELRDKGLKE